MLDQLPNLPLFPFDRTITDLPAEYTEFRQSRALVKVRLWDGAPAWLATRYEDVRTILGDNRFSADAGIHGYPALSPSRAAFVTDQPQLFVRMDPPDHTRLRRMLLKEFAFSRIQALRPVIEKIVDDLIEGLLAGGKPVDFYEHFALPLPSIVMSQLLGFPYEQHDYFQERSSKKIQLTTSPEDIVQANQELRDFVLNLIKSKEKDAESHDDIIGRLIINQIRPGHLEYQEAVSMVELLLMAGHETTANMSTMGVLALFQNPDARAEIEASDSPEFVRRAIEELLRYHTIVQFVGARVALEDVEILGEKIRAGDGILALIDSANRDPDTFVSPEKLNFQRSMMPPQLAFGFGIHQCLGQPLARLELEVVFSKLFKRIPTLRLAIPESELQFKRLGIVHGLTAMPVTW